MPGDCPRHLAGPALRHHERPAHRRPRPPGDDPGPAGRGDPGPGRGAGPGPHPHPPAGCDLPGHELPEAQDRGRAVQRRRLYPGKGSAVYFSKRATHCPGPGDPIPGHFDLVDSLDYETELAVVLGKDAKHVREEDAYDYVFGYTIVNDVSARNLQTGHSSGTSARAWTASPPWAPAS
ncbi:MAG: fumarylacetoacetate hydrolase family protein [Evtepia sp.]